MGPTSDSLKFINFQINLCPDTFEGAICIYNTEYKKACRGDSGGPLVCYGTLLSGGSGYVLAGVVSWSTTANCSIDDWNGFTDVSQYLEFITNQPSTSTNISLPSWIFKGIQCFYPIFTLLSFISFLDNSGCCTVDSTEPELKWTCLLSKNGV